MTEISRYPLTWPPGWRRATTRRGADFRRGNGYSAKRLELGDGISRVMRELSRLRVRGSSVIISSDLKLRGDGLPYADQATSKLDPGVAVYWTDSKGNKRCMAVDRYDRIADNLAAIAATIEAMRAIERHGGAVILDRAFMGFQALAAPAAENAPHEVLGVSERATRLEIEDAYRRLAMQCHPDRGGSHSAMSRINAARDSMLAAL
jgi:hypothetical protein